MLLPILTLPNPELRQRSQEVKPEVIKTPKFQAWLDDLIETMWKADGVGIAAPQVGHPIRVFIAVEGKTPHVIINPVAYGKSWRRENDEEGCLSVPGKFGVVSRYRSFKLRGLDRAGEKISFEASGFFARVLQQQFGVACFYKHFLEL